MAEDPTAGPDHLGRSYLVSVHAKSATTPVERKSKVVYRGSNVWAAEEKALSADTASVAVYVHVLSSEGYQSLLSSSEFGERGAWDDVAERREWARAALRAAR